MPSHVYVGGKEVRPEWRRPETHSFGCEFLCILWVVAENACFSTQMFSYRSDFNTMMEYVFGRIVGTGKPN